MSKRKVDLVKQVIESRIRNYQEIIYANRFDAGPDVKFLAQVQRAINCNKDLLSKLELLRSFELTEDHCSKCLEMIA